MADFTLDGLDLKIQLVAKEEAEKVAITNAMEDAIDDLARIAQNIAPIDKGTLRRSVNRRKRVYWSTRTAELTGTVGFSATEDSGSGRFNYAIWTHEYMDNDQLGVKSQAASGTDGYDVGNKYLERPLKGESRKYFRWFADAVGKEFD